MRDSAAGEGFWRRARRQRRGGNGRTTRNVEEAEQRKKAALLVEAAAAAAADAVVATMSRKEQKKRFWFEQGLGTIQPVLKIQENPGQRCRPKSTGYKENAGKRCLTKLRGNAQERSMSNAEFLPFHLIFCRLPVRQLFQLRCVCKLWNSMLGGAAWAQGEVLPDWNAEKEEYWFVVSEALPVGVGQLAWKFLACSNQDSTYFKVPLPSRRHGALSNLLGGRRCSLLPQLKYGPSSRCSPQLVSAGGLMCAIVHKPDALDDYPVIVFNCLTGSVKVLPPLINPGYLSTGPSYCRMYMAVDDEDPARYYIMLSRNGAWIHLGEDFYSEVFDSRQGYWRVEDNLDSATAISKVPHADFFFYVDYNTQSSALLAYHTAGNVWSKVSVPGGWYDEFSFRVTLLKYKGRLLQGLQLRPPGFFCLGFVVWELKLNFNEAATWIEVARTPEHFLNGVSTIHWNPQLKAEGSLFYMVFEDDSMDGRYLPPLVYDVAQNLWYFVPLPRGLNRFGCICVHRPRLSLRVSHLEGEEQIQCKLL